MATVGSAENPPDVLSRGLEAYAGAHFADAAVILKRSPAESMPERGLANYLRGRAFQELGLRGLALHYLGLAEESETWKLPALREIARAYLAVGEYAAALGAFHRLERGVEDPELRYLAGVAAAGLERWQEAIEILGGIPRGAHRFGAARYVAAQALAASEDFDGALRELRGLSRDPQQPITLRDQARLLQGKILFVEGRTAEAQRSFADVESGGGAGIEALRGLVLTGADPRTAARATVSERRPLDRGTLLLVQAVAAEEAGEPVRATVLREELRAIVEARIHELEALGRVPVARALVDDLGRFAGELRRARWHERFEREKPDLERYENAPELSVPASSGRFEPKQTLFHDAWKRVRLDPALRAAVELYSRCEDLLEGTAAVRGPKPFWMFWRGPDEHLFALALAALRASDLEQMWADHLHLIGRLSSDELRERKRRVAAETRSALRSLYLDDEEIPEPLSNLALHLQYKQRDMDRLIERLPEHSTEAVTSLLGNWIDLLEDTRRRWRSLPDEELPGSGAPKPFAEGTRTRVADLRREIGQMVADVVTPTLRRQRVALARLAADNEGSLSRLYARRQGEKETAE